MEQNYGWIKRIRMTAITPGYDLKHEGITCSGKQFYFLSF